MFYEIIFALLFFWIGCNVGSFLNVCIWRIPRGISIVFPPSHCPNCQKKIPFYFNIPLFGWLFLRGKCRNCAIEISPRYFLMELFSGVIFLSIYLRIFRLGLFNDWEFLFSRLFLVSFLIILSMIDFDSRTLPNKITYTGMVFGLALSTFFPILQGWKIEGLLLPFQGKFFVPIFHKILPYKIINFGFLASLLGIFVGFLFLALFIEFGKMFFGTKKLESKEFLPITITAEKITFAGKELIVGDILSREKDFIKVILENDDNIKIFHNKIMHNNIICPQEHFLLVGKSKFCEIPQEVMGYGDAKMLAMCGAFLGGEMIFFILQFAIIFAIIFAIVYYVLRRTFLEILPFGVFIGLATYFILVFF